ncbi:MAG: Ig-like domain-containing protein [Bacteroidota bacterium]
MKKIFLGIALVAASVMAKAQNGLENIIVEKYYVSNAADAAGSVGTLPTGSVTYRIYADMLPGYKFQAAYGVPGHNLTLTTTTTWFNNEDRGATTPAYTKAQAAGNSVMLDTWLSTGAACAGNFGVLKSEDGAAGGTTVAHASILQNTDPSAGIPLTTQDGLYAGTPEAVTFVGLGTLTDQFDALSQTGNSFITNNGSWASLNGSFGPLANNKVLIAQITTDGVFHYELNIQIGTPLGGTENYVASAPVGTEISIPSLTGTLGAANAAPTVSITSPANAATFLTGQVVTINATAADSDGSVDSVAFFVDGVRKGSDLSSPYTTNWTSTVGTHNLTAKAYDNGGAVTTSAAVQIIVGNVVAPTVSITSPANGATFTLGNTVTINATANDADGTVTGVEFFVDGSSIGVDNGSPYTMNWPAVVGLHSLTAVATDNDNAVTTSAAVSVTVFDSSSAYVITSSSTPCDQSILCVPVRAIVPVDNVIGYDVVMTYNKTKVTPTGVVSVSSDLINPNFTSVANSIDTTNGRINISVFFNATAPANAEFNGSGVVFCVEFVKTAGFTSADTASFAVPTLQESYFNGVTTKVVSPGDVITFQPTAFGSSLRFWLDNSPIRYNSAVPTAYLITNIYGDNATCSNLSATAVQPDVAGNFNYDYTNGVNINIQKDIPGTTSVQPVINGFDAFLTRRVLLNDVTFVPSVYQIIAMDVNLDGVISAGDLSQINQRAVLSIPEFKQAWNYNQAGVSDGRPSKDWSFIDQSTLNSSVAYQVSSTFPSSDGIGYSKAKVPVITFCLPVPVQTSGACAVFATETYTGILVGDVNGNYATAVPNNIFRNAGADQVVFDLAHATTNNNITEIPVSVQSSEAVNSLDFAFTLKNGVTFKSVVNNVSDVEVVSHLNNDDNTLRVTSYSLNNYAEGKAIVTVRLNAAQVTAADLTSVEAYLNGEAVQARVTGSDLSADAISVYPNPSTGMFNVIVSENATVEVLNMEGRMVMTTLNVNANEKATINMQNLAEGVYMIKAFNDNFTSVKRIVVKK